MDIKVEKKENSKISFSIKATPEEVTQFFDAATTRLAKEMKMPGFRPGKVPKDMAKDSMEEKAIDEQAQELAINDTYFQMIQQEKIIPLSQPEDVKISKFSQKDGIEWTGSVDILPEINLGNWKDELKKKKDKIKMGDVKVGKDEVDKSIDALQKQFADLNLKEGKTEKGNWISLDIDMADSEKEKHDPVRIKKFQSKGFGMVIGEAQFIPGFEEELIGLEKETEKEFDIIFPKEYIDKEIAGQKVRFKIKINEIKEVSLPKFDDEFAKKFGKGGADDLKGAIEDDIKAQREQKEKAIFEDKILDEIIKSSKFEVPNTLIEQEKDMIMDRLKHDLEHNKGASFTDYATSLGKSEQDIRDGYQEHAVKNVKMGLVLGQITKNEKIEANQRDIDEVMSMDIIKQTAGMPSDKIKEFESQLKERYKDEGFLNSVKNSILARKTIDSITSVLK